MYINYIFNIRHKLKYNFYLYEFYQPHFPAFFFFFNIKSAVLELNKSNIANISKQLKGLCVYLQGCICTPNIDLQYVM